MAAPHEHTTLLFLYRLCYGIGTICTVSTVALLGWVAYCIAIEAEPLASLSFLPAMPVWYVFILIAAVLVLGIAAWQKGAQLHQQYEAAQHQLPRS